MRVKDPFDELEVGARKALLVTICGMLLVAAYALVFPTQVAIVAMIASFPIMIFLHEFGHFVMAKRAGMKVTEFFVGFGPRLWSFRRGETEYGLKAIPLGGYCKVIGMTNLEEVDPADEARTFRSKGWTAKVVMALAGPATHFVIAIVLMFAVVFFAGDYRGQRALTTLREVSAGALDAGLRAGDEIVAVNGTAVREWRDVPALVSGTPERPRRAGEVVHIVVRRGDRVIGYDVTLREVTDEGVTRVVAGVAAQVHVPQPGLGASIATAPRQVFEMSWDALKSLGTMFSPSGISNYFRILAGETGEDTNPQNRFVSPIGFGKLASDAVKAGWVNALGLLIAINIFVGLFNLLPLLPFDGGHVAVATYEKVASTVRRRRVQVDMAKLMPVTVAVMALLLFIFLSSVFLDITKPISNPF